MKTEITIEELRTRKLFIGVPMYGGICYGTHARSLMDLTLLLHQYGVEFKVYFIMNESLIQRARNYIAAEFMASACTHLLFVDADVSFNPHDAVALLGLQSDDSPYDVIGGPYPKKVISWEKVKAAVDKGMADENPNTLEKYVGDYVFNPRVEPGTAPGGAVQVRLDQPLEVAELGTGFMMIRRQTFEKYDAAYPHKRYLPDHARTAKFDGSREIAAYFDCEIDPTSRRYLSEDYLFCRNVWDMGGRVWLCPWMKLQHTGTYTYSGSLGDVLSIGAAATVDPSAIQSTTGSTT